MENWKRTGLFLATTTLKFDKCNFFAKYLDFSILIEVIHVEIHFLRKIICHQIPYKH